MRSSPAILTIISATLLVCSTFELLAQATNTRVNHIGELGEVDGVYGLAFSPDGAVLYSGGNERSEAHKWIVTSWDVRKKRKSAKWETGNNGQISALAVSPSGRFIAVGDDGAEFHIYDVRGKHVNAYHQLANKSSSINHLQFLDENHVWSVTHIAIGQRFNIQTNRMSTFWLDAHVNLVDTAAASRNGKTFIWSDKYFLNVKSGGIESAYDTLRFGKTTSLYWSAVSDNGAVALATGDQGMLYLFDLEKLVTLKRWSGHNEEIYCAAAMPKNRGFVTADADGNIKIWDQSGKLLDHVRQYESTVAALAISADGTLLATSGEEQRIVLWDLRPLVHR